MCSLTPVKPLTPSFLSSSPYRAGACPEGAPVLKGPAGALQAGPLFALQNVQQERWSCKVFTSTAAQGYYKRHLDKYGVQVIVIPEADTTNFDIDVYNEIFKSPTTWDMIGGEKVLIIQDDGFLLRKGVENFLGFDYVGAPWIDAPANNYIKANINSNLVGNGGFSLRDVPKSKFITEKYADDEHKYKLFYENQVETAEDVYFVTAMVKEKYNIATTPQAVKFSAEQIIHPESLGFHKVWVYHRAPGRSVRSKGSGGATAFNRSILSEVNARLRFFAITSITIAYQEGTLKYCSIFVSLNKRE